MTDTTTMNEPGRRALLALRSAFVARLVNRMRRAGVLRDLLRNSFGTSSVLQFPHPHPRVPDANAILQPLRRSGVAAGGAGGGGPGGTFHLSNQNFRTDALALAS